MTGCRTYLRGLDISVTALLLVSGVLMIGVGFSSIDGGVPVAELFEQLSSTDGSKVLQVFGPITVLLSLLGLCAAALNLRILLLLFCAVAFVELVAVTVASSPLLHLQAQMDGAMDEVFFNVTPLHKAEPYIQQELIKLQTWESCCGLTGYGDWEMPLPDSCLCAPARASAREPCTPVTPVTFQETWVYSKPCGPVLKNHVNFPIKLRIAIISTYATLAMAAIVVSLALGLHKHFKSTATTE
ncbi:uncharacterized protein [Nerophis lumbriciformis]|uniref:uncharacterized protein isoform X1 n=1 Tax=Nerophis lumbriciformis TaxID=546530 RepID=UPI002ADF8067|nr:tetraspanin-6-like isoform X1 [Nerophis lumbriciformis]